MVKIRYSLSATPFKTADGRTCYSATVQHNGTVREKAFYSAVAAKSGLDASVVESTGNLILDQIGVELGHGNRVELPQISAYMTMQGNFAGQSAEARRDANAKLVVHLAAKGSLKACCADTGFVLENVTKGATVVIRGVSDVGAEVDDTILCGTDVEVHVVGSGLYVGEGDSPDTGAWLADAQGEVLARAAVSESTETTMVCTFPQVDLPEGTYRFCVGSRNGLDPSRYGVTVARRNVTVVAAPSVEEEGV